MRSLLLIGAFIALTNCNLSEKKGTHLTSNVILSSKIDTTSLPNSISEEQLETNAFDSLTNVYVDTATLQGKRHSIMNHFYLENGLVAPEYDTLFDLNYDKFKDYVIGYYGGSGTGIKNIVKVFIFNPKLNYYILDSQLSELTNPTFYIRQKKITSFYIGNGGGGGRKLEWIRNKWTITKEFEVHKEGDSTKWKINYPLQNQKKVLIKPFQMIPPDDILETLVKF